MNSTFELHTDASAVGAGAILKIDGCPRNPGQRTSGRILTPSVRLQPPGATSEMLPNLAEMAVPPPYKSTEVDTVVAAPPPSAAAAPEDDEVVQVLSAGGGCPIIVVRAGHQFFCVCRNAVQR